MSRPLNVLTESVARVILGADSSRDRRCWRCCSAAACAPAELAHLDLSDVREDGDGGVLPWIRQGKGRKDRQVPGQRWPR